MKISASATVILTIEVRTSGSYGAQWKLDDLHNQVAREAEMKVTDSFPGVKIIGKPKIKLCTFEVES